jgi:hypothetical protein
MFIQRKNSIVKEKDDFLSEINRCAQTYRYEVVV